MAQMSAVAVCLPMRGLWASPFDDQHELFEPAVTTVELAELVNESFCANERPELLAHQLERRVLAKASCFSVNGLFEIRTVDNGMTSPNFASSQPTV